MSEDTTTRRRILFVDDDPGFLEMIQRVMAAHSKGTWEILAAESASRAMGLLQQASVDLIAIDVQMPVVDGLQFLSLLNRRHPNLTKVVLTGFATEAYRVACLSNGAELFLEKPMTPADQASLYATLNEVMKFQPAGEEGFQGVLRRVGLPDVIQMECLSTNSSVLEITGRQGSGRIFIHEGAIVHAESGSRRGEEAFLRLLCFRGGEFKLESYQEPPERTIEAPWEFLVMEAARKRDESAGQMEPEVVPDPAATAEAPPWPEVEAPPGEVAPEQGPGVGSREDFASQPRLDLPEMVPSSPGADPGLAPGVPSADEAEQDPGSAGSAGPSRTVLEFMICSGDGTVLHEWQVRNSDLWVNFIEFLSQKARRIGQGLPFGNFKRLEAAEGDDRLIALVREDRGVLVRCREESE